MAQQAVGGGFALPDIVVLTVRDGRITHLRDHAHIPAAVETSPTRAG